MFRYPRNEAQRDIIARNISGRSRQIRKLNRIASQSRIPSFRNPRFFPSRTILTKRRRGRGIHVLSSQIGNSNNFDYSRCSDSRNPDRHFFSHKIGKWIRGRGTLVVITRRPIYGAASAISLYISAFPSAKLSIKVTDDRPKK